MYEAMLALVELLCRDTIMNKDFVKFIPLSVFLHGNLTPGFTVVNADGFDGSLNYIHILNTMDVPVVISYDGQYNHEYIKSDDFIDVNFQLCSSPTNKRSLLKKKTKIYVRGWGEIPKWGNLIISGFYQE